MAKQHATQVGSATLNGILTKVLEADSPQGKAKLWVEEKYGLVIRFMIAPKTGQPETILEVRQLNLSQPAASVFVLPPACAKAAKESG